MTTIEKDRLLADFIGTITESSIHRHKTEYQWNLPFCEGYYPSLDTMKFNQSWDWLIPVFKEWNKRFLSSSYTPEEYSARGITLNIINSDILNNNVALAYEHLVTEIINIKRKLDGKDTTI